MPVDKDTIYDDTAIKKRVKDLEDKPEKPDQTLSINDRTISISNGNSIELPVDKDTKYTVKGSGLIMDPDNSIRLDAAPKFYNYNRISDKNGVKLDEYDFINLSDSFRHIGNLRNVIDGLQYRLIPITDYNNLGLITEITNSYDITINSIYNDEYGNESKTRTVHNQFSYTTQTRSGDFNHRIILNDYTSLDVHLQFDVSGINNEIGFGYTNTLIFNPESDNFIYTYTKPIEYNEMDSKEPIIISVMDGSKEKYHIEVIINYWKLRVRGHDVLMSFKDINSDGYINRGGSNV